MPVLSCNWKVYGSENDYTLSFKAAGKDRSSFTSYNIEQGMATNRTDENTLKNTATALFAAGSDTVRDSFCLLFRDGTKQLVRLYRYLLRSFLR